MQQVLSSNVVLLEPLDQIGPDLADSLKIYLTGSTDLNQTSEFLWQKKFVDAFVKLVDKTTGILAYSRFNYTLITNYCVPADPNPGIFNQEQINKLNWELDVIDAVDCVFLNFLKKSTAVYPMFLMGYLCQYSDKLIVRAPEQYIGFATVYGLAQRFGFAFVPGRIGSVSQIMGFMQSLPRFQQITQTQLPE